MIQVDPLSAMGSLNLGGTATSHTQSMQGFPTPLSSAFSNPQSPAKAFPPLTNPNPSTAFGGISSLSSQLPGYTFIMLTINIVLILQRSVLNDTLSPEGNPVLVATCSVIFVYSKVHTTSVKAEVLLRFYHVPVMCTMNG